MNELDVIEITADSCKKIVLSMRDIPLKDMSIDQAHDLRNASQFLIREYGYDEFLKIIKGEDGEDV